MSPPQDRSLASRAEGLFAELLVRLGDAPRAQIDALCAEHPELAHELGELYRQRERMRTLEARAAASMSPELAAAVRLTSSSSSPGARLGSFELLRLLGRGGMGEVWEAHDHALQRKVALKLLQQGASGSQLEQSRFRREAEAAGRVQHRGIVVVLSAGEVEGRRYIAQELVPGGRTLRDLLDELRRLPELPSDHYQRVARLFFELTDALENAHAAGIVHRDLKPQNILLAPDGSPKVADFGLARLEGDVTLSRTGDFLGTYYYASPEQAAPSGKTADARSDVFSLGVSLYECLTLRRPFDGDSIQQVVQAILGADPPDPRSIFSRVPSELAVICLKALEKRPEARYASMAAFREDLRRHLADEPILAKAPSAARRAQKWMLRHPTLSTATALGAVALVTVSLLFARSVRARDDAEEARNDLARANEDLELARDEALTSATEAGAQAAEARRESEAREVIITFLSDLFLVSNPELLGIENPTARELLQRGVRLIRGDTGMDAAVQARLLKTMAEAHEKLGQYRTAKELLLEADAIWVEQRLADHPERLEVANTLGMVEYHLGDSVAAEGYLVPLVERSRSEPEFDPQTAWIARNTLGRLRADQGRFTEAQQLLEESLAICRAAKGEGSVEVLGARNDLAMLEWISGRAAEAETRLRALAADASDLIEQANPAALEVLNNLGLVLTVQGRLDEAEEVFEDLIGGLTLHLDSAHPSLLRAQNNLARVWQAQGELGEAEELYRELLDAHRAADGVDGPGALLVMNNLGTCLSGQGRYEEAEKAHRMAWSSQLKFLGPDHPQTLTTQNNLAFDLLKLGRARDALPLQEEVLARTLAEEPSLEGRRILLEDIRKALDAAPGNEKF